MLKPLIRTLNGWRFERPLALVLGAAAAFAMIAMPWSPFGRIPAVVAHGLERPLDWLLAAVAAVLAGMAAFRAMKYPWPVRAAAPAIEPEAEGPSVDVSLRLRRSDAHPDFPPREPIRASRDLGEPFMAVVGFGGGADAAVAGSETASERIRDAGHPETPGVPPNSVEDPGVPGNEATGPGSSPAPAGSPPAGQDEPDPDAAAIATREPALPNVTAADAGIEAPMPPATQSPLTLVGDVEEHPSIAAFTPEPLIEPAPHPERARRESLAEMMERLSAGLERRAGRPVAPPPADMLAEVLARPRAVTPELRDALDELNRLAGRRG